MNTLHNRKKDFSSVTVLGGFKPSIESVVNGRSPVSRNNDVSQVVYLDGKEEEHILLEGYSCV